jgi:excisionase family DNA binding protein
MTIPTHPSSRAPRTTSAYSEDEHRKLSPASNMPLLDINQAAALLGVTDRFMRRLVDERRIPFHKIGKYVRFDTADLDHFIAEGRVESARS